MEDIVLQGTESVQAALGVFGAVALVALCATVVRAAIVAGFPVGVAVALGAPPVAFLSFPFVLFKALFRVPVDLRLRGAGLLKKGAHGALSPLSLLLATVVLAASCAVAIGVCKATDVSGEPMQTTVLQALVVGGLISGVLITAFSHRVGFIESLWACALLALFPVLLPSVALQMFTYGTAPAYFAVILLTAYMVTFLCLILGGSLGYLFFGDGEAQLSWGFESLIGRRFLMGKRGDSVVGIITVISVLAVAVGTCAMVVVMSVMNGFSTDLRSKIFGANAHLLVLKYGTDFTEYSDVVDKTKAVEGITGATPFVLNEVMVSSDTNLTGALLKGIDTATIDGVTVLRQNMTRGRLEHLDTPQDIPAPTPGAMLPPGHVIPEFGGDPVPAGEKAFTAPPPPPADAATAPDPQLEAAMAAATKGLVPASGAVIPGVVIGIEMSKNLKVFVGDVINVVSPVGELGPTGPVPKSRAFRVAGIFYSGMYEYDSKFVYISLKEAQDFFTLKGAVTGVEYKVSDVEQTQAIAHRVMTVLGGYPYRTKDWMEMNRNLFSALKLEKIAMFIILNVITIVASFLIAATLIVFVIEKSKEIAILKTMGSSDTSIMKIFITYGVIVGGLGTSAGIAFGLLVCFLIKTFGIGLDPDVYYITNLPVHVETFEVVMVGVAAMVLTYLATIYPALLAARLRPVEGLRYE